VADAASVGCGRWQRPPRWVGNVSQAVADGSGLIDLNVLASNTTGDDAMTRLAWSAVGLWLCAVATFVCPAAEETKPAPNAEARQQSQQALERFNSLIGGWRGVGQPRRNSSSDAWSETAEWVWDIKKDKSSVGIRYQVKNGKLLESALLTYDSQAKQYALDAKFTDKTERRYTGKLADGKLTMESGNGDDGNVHQVVVTLLNDKRTLVLFQSKKAEQK